MKLNEFNELNELNEFSEFNESADLSEQRRVRTSFPLILCPYSFVLNPES